MSIVHSAPFVFYGEVFNAYLARKKDRRVSYTSISATGESHEHRTQRPVRLLWRDI